MFGIGLPDTITGGTTTSAKNCTCSLHGLWDLRQDRGVGNLVDELQLVNLRGLSVPSAPVVAGMSNSKPCPGAVSVESPLCSVETCVEDETVDSSERYCCEELDLLLDLLHIVSPTLPAVGFALSYQPYVRSFLPAAGPLFHPLRACSFRSS